MPYDVVQTALSTGLAGLPPGALVVGFSGGLDSTVLLHALGSQPAARARGLRALHVDHRLHADSTAWAARAAGIAHGFDVDWEIVTADAIDCAGVGLEGAARKARYARFSDSLRPGEILALAHHADDQAETVLLKLLRGAGPEGLGGMRALREFAAGRIWRPLLELPRAALRGYAEANGLGWIEDPSNADTRVRRNFLRNEIVPRLAQRWPDASSAIAHSARWSRAAADFIGAQSRLALARLQGVDPATLAWVRWLELPDALRDPVLRLWLRSLGFAEPAHFQVGEIERQLNEAGADASPCVSWENCEVRRHRDLLYALRPLTPLPAGWGSAWRSPSVRLPDGSCLVWQHETAGEEFATQDYPALRVCYRAGGERMRPHDGEHTRELRTLLQENGIPPWLRDRIPLIYEGEQMIAAADLIMSARARELGSRLRARIAWDRSEGEQPAARNA